MMATNKGQIETVKLLIDRGADVNAKQDIGLTALMIAVIKKGHEIVRLLIDSGVDVNAKDNSGKTALLIAIYVADNSGPGQEQKNIINLLIAAGAKK